MKAVGIFLMERKILCPILSFCLQKMLITEDIWKYQELKMELDTSIALLANSIPSDVSLYRMRPIIFGAYLNR